MLNELKILFENIKNFRHLNLLTEAVDQNDIVDAINNHEYIYIKYAGDSNNAKGYRTIRPYVLGTTSAGNLAVRAWQDKGNSDSGATRKPIPMWRLFRVDKMLSILPIGKKFNDSSGKAIIPPDYNENDEQLSGIIASISANPEEEILAMDSEETSTFKTQTSKWKNFYNANANNKKIQANDIIKLYDIAKKVMKKSPNNFFIAVNDKNEYSLQEIRVKSKFPPNAIVGDLSNLYDKLVRQSKPSEPEQDRFFKQEIDKAKKENVNNVGEKKTFFK